MIPVERSIQGSALRKQRSRPVEAAAVIRNQPAPREAPCHSPLAFLSLLVELAFGYPDRLVRAIGHPVIWIGRLISLLDRDAQPRQRRRRRSAASPGSRAWRSSCCWRRSLRRQILVDRFFALIPFGIVGVGDRREQPARAAQPRRACRGGRRRARDRRPRRGRARRSRRSSAAIRSALDEAGVSRARDREPGREFLRRRRRAGLLAGGRRACRAAPPTRRSTPPTA